MKHNKLSSLIGYKTLQTLYNEGPHEVVFMTNDPDEWIVEVIKYTKKNGIIIEQNTIIKKDMNRWIEIYKDENFTLTKI